MFKWVARIAVLAAFLGLVGTIAIISYLHRDKNKEKQNAEVKKGSEGDQVADTQKAQVKSQQPTPQMAIVPDSPEKDLVKEEDTFAEVSTLEKENPEKTVKALDTIADKKKLLEKSQTGEKVAEKKDLKRSQKQIVFNQKEMRQLFIQINKVKAKHNVYSNCIQLFSTEQGNNRLAARQVEAFLKSHHFTIAGREMVPLKTKGIKITPAGGCLRIIIGTLQ